jgi:putative DNA primase/helicase
MNSVDVIGQMLAAGLEHPPTPLDLSGRVRRFGPKKRQWYRLREMRTDGGQYVVFGSFGDWRGQESHKVEVDWKGLGQADRDALQAQRQAVAAREAAEREAAAKLAAMSAAELWASAARQGASAYLQRKGVAGEACRYLPDGSIVLPLLRYDKPREEALHGLQRIFADGRKRFTRGFDKPGTALRLGLVEVSEPILICEGYATGLTLRDATSRRLPVFVAIDAGNLGHVATLVRQLHPESPLLICADDDWHTQGNPGRAKALEAARALDNARFTYPMFMLGQRGEKDTDFNDLALRCGVGVVRKQLRLVMPMLGSALLANG